MRFTNFETSSITMIPIRSHNYDYDVSRPGRGEIANSEVNVNTTTNKMIKKSIEHHANSRISSTSSSRKIIQAAHIKMQQEMLRLKIAARKEKIVHQQEEFQDQNELLKLEFAALQSDLGSQFDTQEYEEMDVTGGSPIPTSERVDAWISQVNNNPIQEPRVISNIPEPTRPIHALSGGTEYLMMESPCHEIDYGNPRILSGSSGISVQQREWRKTIGKDLPKFGGDPEEWPEYANRFRSSTEKCGFDDQENMSRLRCTLVGRAKDAVRDLLLVSEDPQEIIAALKQKFERPDHVIRLLLGKVRKCDPPKEEDYAGFCEFVDTVRHYVAVVESVRKTSYLYNSIVLDKLIKKLGKYHRMQWAQHIVNAKMEDVSLKDFAVWIEKEVNYSKILINPSIQKKSLPQSKFVLA